jgi:hypothetical protein
MRQQHTRQIQTCSCIIGRDRFSCDLDMRVWRATIPGVSASESLCLAVCTDGMLGTAVVVNGFLNLTLAPMPRFPGTARLLNWTDTSNESRSRLRLLEDSIDTASLLILVRFLVILVVQGLDNGTQRSTGPTLTGTGSIGRSNEATSSGSAGAAHIVRQYHIRLHGY